MIISHSHKFIFIHLHKTAGESVSEALLPYLASRDLVLGTGLRGELATAWYNSRYKLQKHSGARKVRKYVGDATWDDYLTFSFVRDPVDRARSLYFYYEKMQALRRERSVRNALLWLPGMRFRDSDNWPGMQAFRESASFSEFIRHPKFSPSYIGTRRQADSLCDGDGRLLVDVVGKFETLQEDFAAIAARIGLPQATLGHRNASRNRTKAADPVSPGDRAHLEAMYARDYQLFGYPTTSRPTPPQAAEMPAPPQAAEMPAPPQAAEMPMRPASSASK
jgi:hypothetical protein